MNYINRLETQCRSQELAAAAMAARIEELRRHLDLPKFAPVQTDGSRGDWISTADVQRWLRYIAEGAHS